MADWRLARQADEDLVAIFVRSLSEWGPARAESYRQELRIAFSRIVDFPLLGRDASALGPGLRRIAAGSHVVFYRRTPGGILIVRVLHESQDVSRHL